MASKLLHQKRRIYAGNPIPNISNPFTLFGSWFKDAEQESVGEHNAMTLATVSGSGKPSVRQLLLKEFNKKGFSFFTNLDSRKAKELSKNPNAALLFYWPELHRQVRIDGRVVRVSDKEADAYFATRPRGSQIGAWISKQSSTLKNRATLKKAYSAFEKKFKGKKIPRPPHWGGFRLIPREIEFWSGMPSRLHDRLIFIQVGSRWTSHRLFP